MNETENNENADRQGEGEERHQPLKKRYIHRLLEKYGFHESRSLMDRRAARGSHVSVPEDVAHVREDAMKAEHPAPEAIEPDESAISESGGTAGVDQVTGGDEEAEEAGAVGSEAPEEEDAGLLGSRRLWAFFALILVSAAIYLFYDFGGFRKANSERTETESVSAKSSLTIYFPHDDSLEIEVREVPEARTRLEAATRSIEEFLAGRGGPGAENMFRRASVIGVYIGINDIVYVDFSDEFRSDFSGDALSEFMMLKALYESVSSNVSDVMGVRILIEGQEIESLGGHVLLNEPLSDGFFRNL